MLHGIRSHAGWYAGSLWKFADAGYEACFLDRRGSGQNAIARGDCPGYRRLVADVVEFMAAQPEFPTHLVGISWGGKLATLVAEQVPVKSLVLIAPGFVPKVRPALHTRLRILLARLIQPMKLFPVPLNEPKLFTKNLRWQQFLQENPHDLHEGTARFFVSSVGMDLRLRRATFPRPTLTLLAGEDEIIDNQKTRGFLAGRTEFREYAGLAHTLEFEDETLAFTDDVVAWWQSLGKSA
jgi:alpha-beta hydrolase superfamily lysophospholipase